jgi:hypothetical protein
VKLYDQMIQAVYDAFHTKGWDETVVEKLKIFDRPALKRIDIEFLSLSVDVDSEELRSLLKETIGPIVDSKASGKYSVDIELKGSEVPVPVGKIPEKEAKFFWSPSGAPLDFPNFFEVKVYIRRK